MPSQIKGTGIQIYRDWLNAKLPPPQVAMILARLAAPSRAVVDEMLASKQYPYSLYGEFLEASKAVLGDAYQGLAVDHGRYAADVLLAGIYRLTIKAGEIDRTLLSLARGWRIYFDTGQIDITDEKPGRCVFVIMDTLYHPLHPPISGGYIQRACEIAGATNVDVDVRGAPPRVEMVVTWS